MYGAGKTELLDGALPEATNAAIPNGCENMCGSWWGDCKEGGWPKVYKYYFGYIWDYAIFFIIKLYCLFPRKITK